MYKTLSYTQIYSWKKGESISRTPKVPPIFFENPDFETCCCKVSFLPANITLGPHLCQRKTKSARSFQEEKHFRVARPPQKIDLAEKKSPPWTELVQKAKQPNYSGSDELI